jgi:hypothetical protein
LHPVTAGGQNRHRMNDRTFLSLRPHT